MVTIEEDGADVMEGVEFSQIPEEPLNFEEYKFNNIQEARQESFSQPLAIAPIDIEFSETFQDPYVPLALHGSNPQCRDTNIDEIIQNAALDAITNSDLEAESELSITSTSSPLAT